MYPIRELNDDEVLILMNRVGSQVENFGLFIVMEN